MEKRFEENIPPSYGAFLQVYSGCRGMPGCGGADLLGVGGHESEHVVKTLKWKSEMFNEFEETNPIEEGAIPLAIGDDRNKLIFGAPHHSNGEMDIVKYYLTEEVERFPNLLVLFENIIEEFNI